MKNLVYALLCVLTIGGSCKKQSVEPTFFLKATIDGKSWEASTVSRTLGVKNPDGTQNILYNGQNSNKEVLSLILSKQPSMVGTYNLGSGGIGAVFYSPDALSMYSSINSTNKIIIESVSEEAITGSFEIDLTGGPPAKTIKVKAGSFRFPSK
jgi:hypothetical protein